MPVSTLLAVWIVAVALGFALMSWLNRNNPWW